MTQLVQRGCTEVKDDGQDSARSSLSGYRETGAYVLLGDPGSGKTSSFKAEALAIGGCFITARDFLTFDVRPEWRGQTLFIDGLDETRAGAVDGRVPLDQLRRKLDQLGRPRFRLSCREADWLGSSDRTHLNKVAPDGEVLMLRLEPLSESEILELLDSRDDVPDAQAFFTAAREHGLAELLTNPQTLDLLARATRGGRWPDSRSETFELACGESVKEVNDEHAVAMPGTKVPRHALLDNAGYLCAVMLLADESAISIVPDATGGLDLGSLHGPASMRAVLATRLFTGYGGTERFSPVHRTVAEYLAARHLARRITDGLPVGRVLALMTGPDGGVVSGLRGLHAWLAVHCVARRALLIATDPLGVVLYGDVRDFSTQDKTRVLEELADLAGDDPGFRRQSWNARPFGALCTPDMEGVFCSILTSPSREAADQALVDCVVDALHYGPPLPALTGVLLSVVRQADRWAAVRHGALQASLRHLPPDGAELVQLLDDLRTGLVPDDTDELLGMCLETLYPGHISVHQLTDFLHTPKQSNLLGSYLFFWTDQLPKRAPRNDFPVLLDNLVTQGLPAPIEREHLFKDMAGKLLSAGLEQWGDRVEGDRLYAWLGLGLDEYGHPRLDGEHHKQVHGWLSARPGRYKDVVACAIRKLWNPERPMLLRYSYEGRLYGATPPSDFGLWLLSLAENDSDPARAGQLFEQVVSCLSVERGHAGLSIDFFATWVGARPHFRERWEPLLYCEIPEEHRERMAQDQQRVTNRAQQRTARAQAFREHLSELREGAGHPQDLCMVARAFKGLYSNVGGETSIDRLKDLMDGDTELVLAALSGLRQSPFRTDLPSVEEIVRLDLNGEEHYIRLPCLVAAQEHFREAPDAFLAWPEEVLKRLVAFRLTDGTGAEPDWAKALARVRPDQYAEVFSVYATRLLTAPDKHIHGLYGLQHDEGYADVARRVVPQLLRVFPTAASGQRLDDLASLLKAGLQHVDTNQMAALISERLAMTGVDDAQQTFLLAAGLLLAPAAYEARLRRFVDSDASRVPYLLTFLHERIGRRGMSFEFPASAVGLLIELLGPVYALMSWPAGFFSVSPEMEASEFIEKLIYRLGADPSEQANHQIAALLNDPRLEGWWPTLNAVRPAQRVVHREAEYRHPSPAKVEQTLANRAPANAADLAALTGEILQNLAREIRHGNTDAYKQFWNLDGHARPTNPRVEDACRDTLLDRLRERLNVLHIDAQPEGHYADDTRADIRVACGGSAGFNVPVEIKRDRHRDLWGATHGQLIARYTRDPGAAGYGIYLVFWFGGDGMPANPAGTARPQTASDLETQLRATLSGAEQRLIQVCVMDVAESAR